MPDWVVYILRCADNSLYTGITVDVERRLHEHNHADPSATAYTRGRRPVQLVYQESHPDRSNATRRELEIKRMTRKQKQTLIKIHRTRTTGRHTHEQH